MTTVDTELTLRNESLQNTLTHLRDIQDRSQDIIIQSNQLTMTSDAERLQVHMDGAPAGLSSMLRGTGVTMPEASNGATAAQYHVCGTAHRHLSGKLGIPWKYYQRLQEGQGREPQLLRDHVNHWLSKQNKPRLLRTLTPGDGEHTGYIRAFLSDRYKILNNFDVLATVLEGLKNSGLDVDVPRCDLSEKKLYVAFKFPGIGFHTSVPGMEDLQAGLLLQNSDVGHGTFLLKPRLYVVKCTNGWVVEHGTQDAIERRHLGSKMETGVIDWSRRTQEAERDLLVNMAHDATETFATREYWRNLVERIQQEGREELDHPVAAMKNVTSDLGYSDSEVESIVEYFVDQPDPRKVASVPQAMTQFAHSQPNADRQYEIEGDAMRALTRVKDLDYREN